MPATRSQSSSRARRYRLAAALLASSLLAPLVRTQERHLTLQNLAPLPRREVAAVVVPFARGTVPKMPELHVENRATAWQPFGARWPDGSLRQALCLFETQLDALAESTVKLVAGKGPELPSGDVPLAPVEFELLVYRGEKIVRAAPERVRDLEHNAMRRVELRRCRIGDTGLVAEVLVTTCRGQAHAWLDVALYFSDPTTPQMSVRVDEVALKSDGLAAVFRHAPLFDVRQRMTETGSRTVLFNAVTIGDGQGIRRTGVLVPGLTDDPTIDASSQAATVAPVLGATSWCSSGAFGAFGHVPPLPTWLQGPALRRHLADRHARFVKASQVTFGPFAHGPMQQAKYAGQTGDQEDFGVVKLTLVAASGIPSQLFEAEASMLQTACRPVHFYAASGAPIDPADRPEWVVWSGRTHWHNGQSKDRLGKPHPEPKFETHGWTGKDRQHWSSNCLGAYALLTGAHWARRELEHELILYLAGQTLDPAFATSNSGAPRGAGRTELAATWIWLATGDERLLERMNARIDRVYHRQWAGRDNPTTRVRAFAINHPDARMLAGKTHYWTPWQEALAAVGFGAAAQVTQNPRARELAEGLACNLVRHGWLVTDKECIVATALRWQDGRPLSAAERRDPAAALWSYGTAFNDWAIGAVEIARATAERAGDEKLAQLAASIQQRVRSARRRPNDGGLDRLTEWDAVRWPPKQP